MDFWLPPKPAIIRPAPDDLRRDWRREPKKASFLPGWFPAGAVAGGGPDLSVVSTGADATNTDIYTFSSVPFGAAASDRLLIMALGGGSSSNGVTLGSVTIGGVSATIHAQANNTGNTRNGHAAVVSAVVAAGTSGTIVVTWIPTVETFMLDMAYTLYRVTGLQSATPTDTATASGGSPTMSIDRANNGFIIAAASAQGASFNTWPSPMVTDIDSNTDGTWESMAHTPVTIGAVTNFNAGPSNDGGSPSRYAAASWA
jgi:hypothetical protein